MKAKNRKEFLETWKLEANRIGLLQSSLSYDDGEFGEVRAIVRRINEIAVVAAGKIWPEKDDYEIEAEVNELLKREEYIRTMRQNKEHELWHRAAMRLQEESTDA